MNRKWFKNSQAGFLTLLGLLLVLIIIAFLFRFLLNVYFRKPALEKQAKSGQLLPNVEVATPTYTGVLDSTRKKIQDFNQQIQKQEKQTEEMGER